MVVVFLVCCRVQRDQLLQRGGPSVLLQDEGVTTGWKQHVLPTNTTRLDVLPESGQENLPVIATGKSLLSGHGSVTHPIQKQSTNKHTRTLFQTSGQNQGQRADNNTLSPSDVLPKT